MNVRMLWKHLFACMYMHVAVIVLMWKIATFMPMEMVVNSAVRVLVQMRMQNLVFPVLGAHRLYPLYKRNRNRGAPRNDVIAPIGKMTGDMTIRATISEASMIVAPKASDAGSRNR